MGEAFSMLAPVLVGVLLGDFLDKFLDTSPLFIIIMTLWGVATGIYSVIKKAYNMNKK